MDIGRIIKNIFQFTIYTIFCLILIIFSLWFLRNLENAPDVLFGKTDIGGIYYISFDHEDNDIINAQITYNKIVYNEPVDLSGVEILLDNNKMIPISSDIIFDDNAIKQMLIDMGYAKATKEDSDVSEEKNTIEKEHLFTDDNEIILHHGIKKIYDFLMSQTWKIIKWLIVSAIGISTIFSLIVNILRRKRINIVFMGSVSSGKTTLIRRLVDPNINESKLINEITPTELANSIKGKRIAVGKKDIYPSWVDNPGNDLGAMIDDVVGKGKVLFAKNVGVYVLAPSPSYNSTNIINEYKAREITRALTTIKAIKKAESIRTPEKIVLFINKMDLIYCDENDFYRNIKKVKKSYMKDNDYDELIEIVDEVIVGSALRNWEIDTLLNCIIE